jgi:hypothetical protein
VSLPEIDSTADLSLAELRALVGTLATEVSRLQAENRALKADNQAVKDEIARLKGLPPRPPKAKPSGMEKATQSAAGCGKAQDRSKRGRGAKRDRLTISDERVVKAAVPSGSRFKGYEDVLVQDLQLSARVIRYRRERWLTPAGERVVAPLPAGVVGGFGPELRRFLLAAHIQGQVTTERLTALLTGLGLAISKRQVVRLLSQSLETFRAEDRDVLRAGLSSARWISVDDTAARHANRDGYTTQIGDDRSRRSAPASRSRARPSWRRSAPATASMSSMMKPSPTCADATSLAR